MNRFEIVVTHSEDMFVNSVTGCIDYCYGVILLVAINLGANQLGHIKTRMKKHLEDILPFCHFWEVNFTERKRIIITRQL